MEYAEGEGYGVVKDEGRILGLRDSRVSDRELIDAIVVYGVLNVLWRVVLA